jgi:SAM-dependent methyltransferase
LSEKHTSYWDEVARSWQEAAPKTLWRAYNDKINNALFAQWLPTDHVEHLLKTDLFDESLGEGLYPLMSSRAKIVFGIDLSVLTVRAAKLRHEGLCATQADVRHLPFANGVFNVIVSNSTLDHFESSDEIANSLYELHRVLRPGGQLLITLDNLANPAIALRRLLPFRLLNRLNIVPYYVGATFGPHRLRKHIEQTGLKILEIRSVMHFPRIFTMAMTRILGTHNRFETKSRFLSFLTAFEHLSKWPTRFITGYFVAVKAIKRL